MEKCDRYYFTNGKINSEYYSDKGKYHRKNLPAVIYYYANGNIYRESYYINGKRHREDGPFYITYFEDGNISDERYCLNDVEYTDKDITDNWKTFCSMQIFR